MLKQNKGSQKQFEEQMARCNRNYYNFKKAHLGFLFLEPAKPMGDQ